MRTRDLVLVIRDMLFGQEIRRTPSFTTTLHRGLSYLVNWRHPSSVSLADTMPHIERLQSSTSELFVADSAAAPFVPDEPL